MTDVSLPSYLDQSDAVRDRFERLKKRPVALEVRDLHKVFPSRNGPVTALKNINLNIHKREYSRL